MAVLVTVALLTVLAVTRSRGSDEVGCGKATSLARARTPVCALPCAWPRTRTYRELGPCSTTARTTACTSWPREVEVTAVLDRSTQWATAAFEVADRTLVPPPGDPAPRTDNPCPATAMCRQPSSTPGPATTAASPTPSCTRPRWRTPSPRGDGSWSSCRARVLRQPVLRDDHRRGAGADPARYGDRMDFVHIELWRDFEAQEINEAATEWIWPDRRGDAAEPWCSSSAPTAPSSSGGTTWPPRSASLGRSRPSSAGEPR